MNGSRKRGASAGAPARSVRQRPAGDDPDYMGDAPSIDGCAVGLIGRGRAGRQGQPGAVSRRCLTPRRPPLLQARPGQGAAQRARRLEQAGGAQAGSALPAGSCRRARRATTAAARGDAGCRLKRQPDRAECPPALPHHRRMTCCGAWCSSMGQRTGRRSVRERAGAARWRRLSTRMPAPAPCIGQPASRRCRCCATLLSLSALRRSAHPAHAAPAAEAFADRSDVQCLHRWQKVLNPDVHKGPWTPDEDEAILRCEQGRQQEQQALRCWLLGRAGWHAAAAAAASSTGPHSCRCSCRCLCRGAASHGEAVTLAADAAAACRLVALHGPQKWTMIAEHLPGRIGKQCRERCARMRGRRRSLAGCCPAGCGCFTKQPCCCCSALSAGACRGRACKPERQRPTPSPTPVTPPLTPPQLAQPPEPGHQARAVDAAGG